MKRERALKFPPRLVHCCRVIHLCPFKVQLTNTLAYSATPATLPLSFSPLQQPSSPSPLLIPHLLPLLLLRRCDGRNRHPFNHKSIPLVRLPSPCSFPPPSRVRSSRNCFSTSTAERLGRVYSYNVTLSRRCSCTSRGGARLTTDRCVVVFLLDSSIPFRAVGSSNKVDEE